MSSTIPEYWDVPTADAPREARPIGWCLLLPAVLASLVVPTRLGPRIARTSFTKIALVHVAGLALALAGLLLVTGTGSLAVLRDTFQGPLTLSEKLRLPFVAATEWLYEMSQVPGALLPLLFGVVAIPATFFVLAALSTPILAAGERTRSALARATKLVFWSVMHGVLAIAVIELTRRLWWTDIAECLGSTPGDLPEIVACLLALLYWRQALMRLGARYGGPPLGPGWTPRRPLCNGCGYVLTGLSPEGRCPECGLEIARSLPEARALPDWAQAQWPWQRAAAYVRAAWTILRRPQSFFPQLAVQRGREEALRFADWTCWLVGGWAVLNAGAAFVVERVSEHYQSTPGEIVLVLAVFLLAARLAAWVGWAALNLLACMLTRRGLRPITVTTCYALPAFFLLPVLVAAGGWGIAATYALHWEEYIWRLPGLAGKWGEILFNFLFISPAVFAVAWSLRRYARALRATQYAAA